MKSLKKLEKIPKLEEDEYEDVSEDNNNFYSVIIDDHTEYILFLDQNLNNEKDFRRFYIAHIEATAKDTIRIVMNSAGGKLGIFSQIANCLLNTKAKTIAEIYVASSAASFLALLCDEIKPMQFSLMMIHSLSSEIEGKLYDMKKEIESLNLRNNALINIVNSFLYEDEIEKFLKGEEFWFVEDGIKERLKNWTPYRKRN